MNCATVEGVLATIFDLTVCKALCACGISGSLRDKVEEILSNLHQNPPRLFHWGCTIDDHYHQVFVEHRVGQVG